MGPRKREPVPISIWKDRRLLMGGGAIVIAAAVIAISLASRGGGAASASSTKKAAARIMAAGCTFHTYPSEGRDHVQSIDAKVAYNSFPPTSGRHYYKPLIWNRYSQSLPLVAEVHNLEHGGVIIQYGKRVSHAIVTQVTSFYDSSPNAMLLAPLPKLDSKIALTDGRTLLHAHASASRRSRPSVTRSAGRARKASRLARSSRVRDTRLVKAI